MGTHINLEEKKGKDNNKFVTIVLITTATIIAFIVGYLWKGFWMGFVFAVVVVVLIFLGAAIITGLWMGRAIEEGRQVENLEGDRKKRRII